MRRMITALLLIAIVGTALTACGGGGGASKEPTMTIYADGTKGCKQDPYPVPLWNRAGARSARGERIGDVPHATQLDVYQTKEHFGVMYYQVVYEGQRGWVPGNFVSETEPSCP